MRLLAKEVSSYSKLLVFLTALSFILLISFGSSAPLSSRAFLCNDNQEIFSISGRTNAHGETKAINGFASPKEICVNEVFATVPSGNAGNILSLSSLTNAHGSKNPTSVYSQTVSFAGMQCTYRNGQDCLPTESLVIAMSSETNAHFSTVLDSSYPVAVCCVGTPNPWCGNGNIESPSETCDDSNEVSGDGCSSTCQTESAGPKHLECRNSQCVELNGAGDNTDGCSTVGSSCSDTNHLACVSQACAVVNSPGNNLDGCNSVGQSCGSLQITSAVWKIGTNAVTDSTPAVAIGSQVSAFVTFNQNLPAETQIEILIEENDGALGKQEIKRVPINPDGGTSGGTSATYPWTISQTDYDASNSIGDGSVREFIFTAKIVSDPTKTRTSGELKVDSDMDPTNQRPTAQIISPVDGGPYFYCNDISFDQSSSDPEDGTDLEYEWTVGANIGTKKDLRSFTHQYGPENIGQKDIVLEVKDKGTPVLTDKDEISILVLGDRPGVFAFINNPEEGAHVTGKNVDYDAEGSYVLGITGTMPNIIVTCLAGDCPDETEGVICGTNTKAPIIDNGNKGQYAPMTFRWEFDNGFIEEAGRVRGSRVYDNYGNSIIKLLVKYTQTGETFSSNLQINRFNINVRQGVGSCTVDGSTYIDQNGLEHPTTQDNVCNMGGGSCCPVGHACASEGGAMKCIRSACVEFYDLEIDDEPASQKIERCDDYNLLEEDQREIQCELDCNHAFLQTPLSELPDGKTYAEEKCVWDDEEETCGYKYEVCDEDDGDCGEDDDDNGNNGGNNGGGSTPKTCTERVTSRGECINGYQTIEYEVDMKENGITVVDNEDYCPEGATVQIPCGRNVVELPFFGSLQFAISAIMVAMLYIVMFRRELMEKFLNR